MHVCLGLSIYEYRYLQKINLYQIYLRFFTQYLLAAILRALLRLYTSCHQDRLQVEITGQIYINIPNKALHYIQNC